MAATDENRHQKKQTMDAFGRLVRVDEYTGTFATPNPDATAYATTLYGYDVLDNLTGVTDHAGNQTIMAYDALSRKTGMTDPDMGIWSYGYDAAGNLISQTDARGQAITFTYDEINRLTRKYYPMGWVDDPLTTSHSPGVYDLMELRASIDTDRLAAGPPLGPYPWSNPAVVPGRDVTIRAVHFNEMRDPAIQGLWTAAGIVDPVPGFSAGTIQVDPPRPISLRDPTDLRSWLVQFEGSDWASQNGRRARAAYRYDSYSDGQARGYPKGRRTEMWDVSGRTRWTYDVRGRIITEERWTDGQLYTTQWSYDAMDRMTSMTHPDGEVVSYAYNNQLLLQSMSGSVVGSIASDVTYNALDLPTAVKLPNAVADLYLRYRYYGSNLDWGTYPYGALWDIRLEKAGANQLRLEHGYDSGRNVVQAIFNRDLPGWEDFTYEYDALDRLLKRQLTGGADQEWFGYNPIGNLTSKNGVGYTYGSKPHAVTNDGTSPYGYDNNGNMTQRGTGQYIKYDAENRPVKVSSDSGGAQYIARMSYDGDGRRAKRTDNYGTIHYVGAHYERNVGTGQDTTEIITKFYYAQMGKVRRLIGIRRRVNGVDEALRYVVPDHLGGTLRVVDTSGNLIDDIRYHAFGATRSGGANTPTDKRFTGQTQDLSTGLYWYASRPYDPSLGRFVQPDTIVPQPGNPQALNRYSYVLNNPLRYTDPTGHRWVYDPDEPYGGPPTLPPIPSPAPTPVPGWQPVTSPSPAGPYAMPAPVPAPTPATVSPSPVPAPTPDLGELPSPASETVYTTPSQSEAIKPSIYWHQGVIVVQNLSGPVGDLLRDLAGGRENNVTINQFLILSTTSLEPDSPVMKHEMGHIEQAQILGVFYSPVYVGGLMGTAAARRTLDLQQIHKYHPMEVDANRRAGLPLDFGS